MDSADVVASIIFDVRTIMNDPTYAERNDIVTVEDPELGPVRMQAVIPHFTNHAGRVWRTGPALGEDNERVYKGYLGMTDDEFDHLLRSEVI